MLMTCLELVEKIGEFGAVLLEDTFWKQKGV